MARAEITCLDGQTVHLVAGNFKSEIASVTPVVGQHGPTSIEQIAAEVGGATKPARATAPTAKTLPAEILAQVSDPFGGGAEGGGDPFGAAASTSDRRTEWQAHQPHVGYQPVTRITNYGALLQVTPTVIPNSTRIAIDLQSSVIRPSDNPAGTASFPPMQLGQMDLIAQQFMTSLTLPVGQPVVVGGSTLQPLDANAGGQQLYLILEVSVASE